jgi:N-methylhydantoinase B
VQVARDSYGVAIVEGEVDEAATARLRAGMRTEARQHFDHGPARTAFEQLWTPARYALLTAFLAAAPIGWRHFLKQQVFAAVAADAQREMQEIFSDLQQRYPAMMNRPH